jgi:histidinol-phosphatase (PHP family)
MIDAHVHVERGPYTLEWVRRFVEVAISNGLTTLCLLEHSHRFLEFAPLYEVVAEHDPYQRCWLGRRMALHLGDWLRLVELCRKAPWPIELRFGLEVCYVEGKEALIGGLCRGADLDFITGSVHWLDGWGFDHKAESWQGRDVDLVYGTYLDAEGKLVASGLFDVLAHPDSIKCFGHQARQDLGPRHRALAAGLRAAGMRVEQSAGLSNNYGHREGGMSPSLLGAIVAARVPVVTASDAHRPEDVGRGLPACAAPVPPELLALGEAESLPSRCPHRR